MKNTMKSRGFSILINSKTLIFLLSCFLVNCYSAPLIAELVSKKEQTDNSIQIDTYLLGPGDIIIPLGFFDKIAFTLILSFL